MPKPQRYRRRRKGEPFTVPIQQANRTPGPEILPWFWHPDRPGAQPPPEAVAKRLREMDSDLRVCFSPVHERWLVWVKNPRIGTQSEVAARYCKGWQLLFVWEHTITKEFLPLDEGLLFANLYAINAEKYASGESYFKRIQDDAKAAADAAEKSYTSDRRAEQKERLYDTQQISTAGLGNRAALHHSGTFIPSPGEQAWLRETRKWRIPAAQRKQEAEAQARAQSG